MFHFSFQIYQTFLDSFSPIVHHFNWSSDTLLHETNTMGFRRQCSDKQLLADGQGKFDIAVYQKYVAIDDHFWIHWTDANILVRSLWNLSGSHKTLWRRSQKFGRITWNKYGHLCWYEVRRYTIFQIFNCSVRTGFGDWKSGIWIIWQLLGQVHWKESKDNLCLCPSHHFFPHHFHQCSIWFHFWVLYLWIFRHCVNWNYYSTFQRNFWRCNHKSQWWIGNACQLFGWNCRCMLQYPNICDSWKPIQWKFCTCLRCF